MNRHPNLLFVVIATIATLIAYWPSFTVPFYLDDRISLVENKLLVSATIEQLWQVYGMRFVGYLSFWLNIQTTELSLLGFHLTNFFIHLMNGLLLFAIVKQLCDRFCTESSRSRQLLFASAVALIWLLHPLNTQAVTYIVQRLASLVTLFYLLSLLSYFKFRLTNDKTPWSALFILSCILGLLTKQNFIVLFLFILVYELLYSSEKLKHRLFLGLALSFITFATIYPFIPHVIETISNATKEAPSISRYDYFVTQTLVLWTYIAKYFVPLSLQLDMGVELAKPSTWIHFVALIAHLSLIALALFLTKRIPLFTIGIIIFYTGHSVESFVIPITDLAFEHRTYLPNIGLTLSLCSIVLFSLEKQWINKSTLVGVGTVILCIVLATMTYQRNLQWQNPYQFSENEYLLAPNSPRTMTSYALKLVEVGEFSQAEDLLVRAVNKNMKNGKLTVTSINNLMLLLFNQGKYQSAVNTGMMALKHIKKPKERSMTLSNIAYGYIKMGYCDFSIGLSRKAIKLDRHNAKAQEYLQHCLGLQALTL